MLLGGQPSALGSQCLAMLQLRIMLATMRSKALIGVASLAAWGFFKSRESKNLGEIILTRAIKLRGRLDLGRT